MVQLAQTYSADAQSEESPFDYSYVSSAARIAVYDDLLSVPQVTEIPPAPTADFIGALAAEVYNQAHNRGGGIPFTAIKQVAENFIHAHFQEVVVSILDNGNTIRFADQGPGIQDKIRAQQPGFSSATAPMKKYIEGVGSGLPIVREYLDIKHGNLNIEDNLNGGAVVTLTLTSSSDPSVAPASPLQGNDFENAAVDPVASEKLVQTISTPLSKRGKAIIALFAAEDILGVQEIANTLGYPLSSTHTELKRLEEAGLVEKLGNKRVLSAIGKQVASSL